MDTAVDNKALLTGHTTTCDEPFFPMYSYLSTENCEGWIQREYFGFHSEKIIYISFFQHTNTMITIDCGGKIAIWTHDEETWTDFGWYKPKCKFFISCDDYQFDKMENTELIHFDETETQISGQLYVENLENNNAFAEFIFWKTQFTKMSNNMHHGNYKRRLPTRMGNEIKVKEEFYFPTNHNTPFDSADVVSCQVLRYDPNDALIRHYQQDFKKKVV